MKYSMVPAGRKKSDRRDKFLKVAAYLANQLSRPGKLTATSATKAERIRITEERMMPYI